MKTIIYEYGCRLDEECISNTVDQINKARNLYNNIIAIIRNAREEADNYIKTNEPAVAAKMSIIDDLNEQFKAAKSVNDEETMKAISILRSENWKSIKPLRKEAVKKHKDRIAEIFSCIGTKKECQTYMARCDAIRDGLGSTTADDIHATALKTWDKVRKEGGKLSFRSARDRQQDHIIVRFTCAGGVETSDLLTGRHNMAGFVPPLKVGDKQYGEFSFRLGSAKAKTYAVGTWQYHRAFPEGSRVTTIRLIRKKIGPSTRWALQFQLGVPEYQKIETKPDRKPLAALHLGFSLSDDGYRRIGAIADHADTGFVRFLELPDSIPIDLFRAEQIQKRRDENRDNIHAAIKAITPTADWDEDTAEMWIEIKKLPAQYVAAARIVALSRRIESLDWHLDGMLKMQVAELLKDYAIKDYWLYMQQRHIDVKARNRRKNFYRHAALDLVKEYKAIVISRFNLKDMAKRIKDDGERNELGQIARHARHSVALYQLIECLKWACERSGSVLIEHSDMEHTKTCAGCGAAFVRDSDLLQCDCGHEADIKANSAANLYSNRIKTISDDAASVLAEKEAKEQKARDKKLGKIAAMQAKRKLSSENQKNLAEAPVS